MWNGPIKSTSSNACHKVQNSCESWEWLSPCCAHSFLRYRLRCERCKQTALCWIEQQPNLYRAIGRIAAGIPNEMKIYLSMPKDNWSNDNIYCFSALEFLLEISKCHWLSVGYWRCACHPLINIHSNLCWVAHATMYITWSYLNLYSAIIDGVRSRESIVHETHWRTPNMFITSAAVSVCLVSALTANSAVCRRRCN